MYVSPTGTYLQVIGYAWLSGGNRKDPCPLRILISDIWGRLISWRRRRTYIETWGRISLAVDIALWSARPSYSVHLQQLGELGLNFTARRTVPYLFLVSRQAECPCERVA